MRQFCICAHILVVASLVAACGPASAAEGPNLVTNPGFEAVATSGPATEKKPAAWSFGSANPEIFRHEIVAEPGHGNVIKLTALDGKMSGYWTQPVQLKPKTTYEWKADIKLDRGKLLIYSYCDGKDKSTFTWYVVQSLARHPLVPYFWKPEWTTESVSSPQLAKEFPVVHGATSEPGKWKTLTCHFTTGEATTMTLLLGAYFAPGTYWFDNVAVHEVLP